MHADNARLMSYAIAGAIVLLVLFGVQRIEMGLRARRLLTEARASRAAA